MTNIEAATTLHELYRCVSNEANPALDNPKWVERVQNAIEMATAALEKQEGKKPKEARNIYPPEQFECPVCGCCVGRHKTLRRVNDLFGEVLTDCVVEFDFCPDCGQRIDWVG